MEYIKKINFHLSENKKSFLFSLYENRYFDIKKFEELVHSIKKLNKRKSIYLSLNDKYDDCI
jgi:hypothetical protein